MERDRKIKVVNRHTGTVGYTIPEMGIRRQFQPREPKIVTFEELEKLTWTPGGDTILEKYLVITDKEALALLMPSVEPEYWYDIPQVRKILLEGSYDAFLDCLDFAPAGVLEMVKDLAVELEITDLRKRKAIQDKLGFNVDSAIMIKNTKSEEESESPALPKQRRVVENSETSSAPRRRVLA